MDKKMVADDKLEPMTPRQFTLKMKALQAKNDADPEKTHREADYLMCQVLNSLGYSTGVKLFRSMEKWYM